MAAISDSSPLICLAALSDFELLRKIFREVHIPPAVWTETAEQGAGLPVQMLSGTRSRGVGFG